MSSSTDLVKEVPLESPLVELLNKRLRSQKKRLTKIEKYQALDKSQLNADQIETISRKAEVHGNIKELEGILEQVLSLEKLTIQEEKKKEKALEQERKVLVEEAVEVEKNRQISYQKHVQKLTYTLNIPLSSLVGAHSITEDEFSALVNIKQMLFGPFSEDCDLESFIASSSLHFWNFFEKKEEKVPGTGLSYGLVVDLIDRLLSPQPEPRFGMFDMSRAAENSQSPATVMTTGSSSSPAVHMPPFPSTINFLIAGAGESSVSAPAKHAKKSAAKDHAVSAKKSTKSTEVKVDEANSEDATDVTPTGDKPKKKRFRRPKSKAAPSAAPAVAAA